MKMKNKNTNIPSPKKTGVAKVPMIMQMEATECGAACLSMVLAYYGRWVTLEQARQDCGISRDGSNAKNIYQAAAAYGLKAKAYCFELSALREKASYPCIIHWGFNHFVVLNGFCRKGAVLNDPARGCTMVSVEELDEMFTGVCLMFEPGEDFRPGGAKRSIAEFARKRLEGSGAAFLFVAATTAAAALVGILEPVYSRIFIDRLLTRQNQAWLSFFLFGITFLAVMQIVIALLNSVYLMKIQGKFAIVSNSKFMWHVLRLPMSFFSQRMAGDIAMRQKANQDIASLLIGVFAPLIMDGVMMLSYLIIMARYSLPLTCIGVLSVLVHVWTAAVISSKRINITRVLMRDQGNLDGVTYAGIEMIETIKASGADHGFFQKWSGIQASVNTQRGNYAKLDGYLGGVPAFMATISDILILTLGAYFIIYGEFTMGMLLAFQGLMHSFRKPAQSLVMSGQSFQQMRTNMERIEDVMGHSIEPRYCENLLQSEDTATEEYHKLTGMVELKNITFGYSALSEPLITDFSLSIKQGQRIALIGSSGCGKSTVSKLISGLHQPWSGEILFDGKSITEINRQVFTGSLAVVDQDIILFEDTIANNIKMWDLTIEDYQMILAAKDAQIHDDIMQRDGGYQYQILEGGRDFSGGQRQRMEIARALAQNPAIIIMDEATSALDAKTEKDVVNAIKERGITCIVIAHRLSAIRDCDEIIVMEHGKIVERGSHLELMAQGGHYKELLMRE